MSDTSAAATNLEGTPAASRGRAVTIALRVLRAVLVFQFAVAGFLKLSGNPDMVDMFTAIGAGQWLRYAIGLIEIAGAIGVMIPRLSGLAALGLTALMVGATATNLFVIGDSPSLSIGVLLSNALGALLVSALVAWGYWPQTKALASTLKR